MGGCQNYGLFLGVARDPKRDRDFDNHLKDYTIHLEILDPQPEPLNHANPIGRLCYLVALSGTLNKEYVTTERPSESPVLLKSPQSQHPQTLNPKP